MNLEDFIKENREQFDSHEPSPKIWEKIEQERNEPKAKTVRMWRRPMRIAAAITVLALAVFVGTQISGPKATVANNFPSELNEIDRYYENQVTAYLTQVNEATSDQQILTAIQEDIDALDTEKLELLSEVTDGTADQRVIQALLSTYRKKIEVLEDILNLLTEENNEVSI